MTGLVVSTVLLIFGQQRNDGLSKNLIIIRKNFERITLTETNRLLNRIISNIGNGYEPEFNELMGNRFEVYT